MFRVFPSAPADPVVTTVGRVMEMVLHEPPTRALKIATRWRAGVERSRANWAWMSESSVTQMQERVASVEVPGEQLLLNFLNRTPGAMVLATLHMGDYLSAILRLLALLGPRRVVFLRRREANDEETAVFRKVESYRLSFEVVRNGPHAATQIYRKLRQGAVVVLLYDLSRRWGATRNVSILGLPMNWVAGPALLACRSGAHLVPFFTHDDAGTTTCIVDRVQNLSESASNPRCAARVAQDLADLASSAIRHHPDQWHHWNIVPEMLALRT